MGRINDSRIKRKEDDKPLSSLGPKDKPKKVSSDQTRNLKDIKER